MALNKINHLVKNVPVDAKKILEGLKTVRIPISLRIDASLWERFKKAIGQAPQNKVIERLLEEFLKSHEAKK